MQADDRQAALHRVGDLVIEREAPGQGDGERILGRFHLPAPTVKDALGHTGTATLDLTLTRATISIDPAFLASAAYPVTVDPTINYTLQSSGTDFTYDSYAPVSELTTVTADQTLFSTSSYTFDNVRNRTQRVQGPTGSQVTTTYTYDRADRIQSAGAVTYTVDANGNLKARTGGSINDSFSYDQANRLTSATTGSGSGTYTYDGDGKRTSKTVSGATTTYVWDVAGGLPRLLSDGTHKFVWGASGLAYNLTLGASPTVETYHADQIGSIREITNADGSVRTTYLTDEYGNRTSVHGTDDQPFQFTGEQVDPETGFVYLRARYYDPAAGRFVTRDPISGGNNRYSYSDNNPIDWTDRNGAQVTDLPFPCAFSSSRVVRSNYPASIRQFLRPVHSKHSFRPVRDPTLLHPKSRLARAIAARSDSRAAQKVVPNIVMSTCKPNPVRTSISIG